MYTYTIGGKNGSKLTLQESKDRIVVRTKNARKLENAVYSAEGKKALSDFGVEQEFPDADVTVLKVSDSVKNTLAARNKAREILKREPELRFAGRVLLDPDGKTPVVYTENLIIKFFDHISTSVCEKVLTEYQLTVKQKPDYSTNLYFAGAPENTGLRIFELAETLLNRKEVELCHPELIRKRALKKIHNKQWHLKATMVNGLPVNAHVNAAVAHALSTGKNIKIAIIDDGVDIDHVEFSAPSKVVHARDISANSNDPRPKVAYDNHGTACAGVATAAGINAAGVAPDALLIPIRLYAELGSFAESQAFKWAVDHGADVISCSWGPQDGDWNNPADPAHTNRVDLPDSTRLAMEYAFTKGRNGKGCVITFAAGNGNENVKYDGYASYPKVIAVAACNDTNKRSVYSDFGDQVWCCFPSSDFGYGPFNHPDPLTSGIYTTDRHGAPGYNNSGDYTDEFGGTSSACPGVAGTIALILSANPELTLQQVKDIIRDTAVKIDPENGQYDVMGHSKFYGYGKVDAAAAVKKALELSKETVIQPVKIISALVNPKGKDRINENISILNTSSTNISLSGWIIEVKGKKLPLTGILKGGEAKTIKLSRTPVVLANTGTNIKLINDQSTTVHTVHYNKEQVKEGQVVAFG
ncbi:MAG: S8 family serine peptidase [Bacteroidales bacterium]|nr:S8 family serine peptidase [Bacteroidales bacterium]